MILILEDGDENDNDAAFDEESTPFEKDEITETILLKMASMQALSCEIIKNFMNDTCLYKADSDILDVSNLIIKEALCDILAKIDDVEIKAKAFKPNFNILAMLNVGFARVTTSLEKSDYERFPLGFSYFAVQLSTEL